MKANAALVQKLTIKPGMKLVPRIRLASFIQLGEKKFSEYIIEVESDPVFKKLLSVDNSDKRVISCKRFPKTMFSQASLSFEEQLSRDGTSLDVETLLSEKSVAAALIKKVGLANFEKYFLCGDGAAELPEVCRACSISLGEAEKIADLVNDLSVRTEFYHPSELPLSSRINYSKIAEIVYDGKEDFYVNFFSPKYISGRYVINNSRLAALKKQDAFSREEIPRIAKLIEKLELINARRTTIYQILRRIVQVQKNYMYSGEDKFLVSYTQRQLSQDIGFDTSVICRAIYGRSVLTPHGVEKPLKFFFQKNKDVRKKLIGRILENEPRSLTDEQIKQTLKNKFGIEISRRTANAYRNELSEVKGTKCR